MGAPYKKARADMVQHLRTVRGMDKVDAATFERLWLDTGVHVTEYWDVIHGRQQVLPTVEGMAAYAGEWLALGGRSVLDTCDRCLGTGVLHLEGQPLDYDRGSASDRRSYQAWRAGTAPWSYGLRLHPEGAPGVAFNEGDTCAPCDGSGMRLAAEMRLDPKPVVLLDRGEEERHLSYRDRLLYGVPRATLVRTAEQVEKDEAWEADRAARQAARDAAAAYAENNPTLFD